MPPAIDDFIGAVGVVAVDDIDLFALLEQDATLPSHAVRRAAVVEACQRAFVRLRLAWTEQAVRGHRPHISQSGRRRQQSDKDRAGLEHVLHSQSLLQADSGAGASAKAWFSALPGLRYRNGPPS
jgi:hypothetical protein